MKKKTSFAIDEELLEKLKQVAADGERSLSYLVTKTLEGTLRVLEDGDAETWAEAVETYARCLKDLRESRQAARQAAEEAAEYNPPPHLRELPGGRRPSGAHVRPARKGKRSDRRNKGTSGQ